MRLHVAAPGSSAIDPFGAIEARYVVLANGILTTPKLARIQGMETFAGKAFHTSRWDYTYDLEGKRVGIIGTGATARRLAASRARACICWACASAAPIAGPTSTPIARLPSRVLPPR